MCTEEEKRKTSIVIFGILAGYTLCKLSAFFVVGSAVLPKASSFHCHHHQRATPKPDSEINEINWGVRDQKQKGAAEVRKL